MSTSTRTASTGKVVGSIVVVGAAMAVAGLGTFGSFTDTTEAVDAAADTGTVKIDVSANGYTGPFPVPTLPMLPGDSISFPLDLVNGGTADLASLVLQSTAPMSSLLDSDETHGLQLRVQTCESAWAGPDSNRTCAGGAEELYAGPIRADKSLTGAHSLAAGQTDHLLATVSFPTTGGNAMQNQKSTVSFVFVATQRDGAAR